MRSVTDKFFLGQLMNRFAVFYPDAIFSVFQESLEEKTAVIADIWTCHEFFALKTEK